MIFTKIIRGFISTKRLHCPWHPSSTDPEQECRNTPFGYTTTRYIPAYREQVRSDGHQIGQAIYHCSHRGSSS
ncbi:hypothetical protein [Escherichia coli]|uniref:hypothetical protein n=1 Tax=Escherichia coli TaxID=562 RepID=UPI003C2EDB93